MARRYNNGNSGKAGSYHNQNSAQSNSTYSKKSGAKMGNGRNEKPYISAWNVGKKGFTALVACPANDPEHSVNKEGELRPLKKGWERWVASVEFKPSASYKKEKTTHTAFYNVNTRKLYIPDLTMVANPFANNGGYFGKCFVSGNGR